MKMALGYPVVMRRYRPPYTPNKWAEHDIEETQKNERGGAGGQGKEQHIKNNPS